MMSHYPLVLWSKNSEINLKNDLVEIRVTSIRMNMSHSDALVIFRWSKKLLVY